MESKLVQEPNKIRGISYEHKSSQSFKSLMVKLALKFANIKSGKNIKKRLTTGEPHPKDTPEPPKDLKKDLKITSWEVNGRNIYRLEPKANVSKKLILYLHGGAYINNTTHYHWEFVQKLISTMNCTVVLPDFPLAPNNTYLDTYEVIELVYKKIISEVNPNDITFMGDSSGGGLALGFAQKLKHDGISQPDHIILLTPWLDITLTNPEIEAIEDDDPFSGAEPLRMAGKAYAGDADPTHYMLSPINGEIEGLGKLSIFVGTHDILSADAKKLKNRCDEVGIPINYFVYPKMLHVFMILNLSESDIVINQIKDLIQ